MQENKIIQYILINKEIIDKKWTLGAIIAQACHACVAVIAENLEDNVVKEYIAPENLNDMHKVVLQVNDAKELKHVSGILDNNSLKYKLWVEQPENIITALAMKPYHKDSIKDYFKKYPLLKKI